MHLAPARCMQSRTAVTNWPLGGFVKRKKSMNVIEMKKISKSFPGTKAVDAVDFRLAQGEILSLLGENGAGKTTLMKILYGMHAMHEGEISFKGTPV